MGSMMKIVSSFILVVFTIIVRRSTILSFSIYDVDAVDGKYDDADSNTTITNNNGCGLYIAPSTIPGAGLGIYAGRRQFNEGDIVAEPDIVIPVWDMQFHVNGLYEPCSGSQNQNPRKKQFSFLWEEYTWKASNFEGMEQETDDVTKMKACSPGIGALANCQLPLVNLVDQYNVRKVSSSGVSSQSTSAGSFTPYHGRQFKAKVDIEPGSELFLNYGSGYFRTRSGYESVPLMKDYDRADKLVTRFLVRLRSLDDGRRLPDGTIKDNDDNMYVELSIDLWKLVRNVTSIWADDGQSRLIFALPETNDIDTLHWMLDQGGTGMQHYNTSKRSIEWLETNGRCIDNIKDGVSKIPGAGRGAFATRLIRKGEIVAPVPLIHIPDREIFTIYDSTTVSCRHNDSDDDNDDEEEEEEEDEEEEDEDDEKDYESDHIDEVLLLADHSKPVHFQLLLNYCFGHRDSSLLLCPYGLLTSLVNHDRLNANTKVVWGEENDMEHPEWRTKPMDEWSTEDKAGLSFNFVAMRDIQPDEEITIDYGYEWSKAWERHKRTLSSLSERRRESYVTAYERNERFDVPIVFGSRSREDQTVDHTENGVALFCRTEFLHWVGIDDSCTSENDETAKHFDWTGQNEVQRCRIIRINRDESYVAEVIERIEHNETTAEIFVTVAFGLPREAFYFEDLPYQRDHHIRWSFRYDMRIDDNLFPEIWKNRLDFDQRGK